MRGNEESQTIRNDDKQQAIVGSSGKTKNNNKRNKKTSISKQYQYGVEEIAKLESRLDKTTLNDQTPSQETTTTIVENGVNGHESTTAHDSEGANGNTQDTSEAAEQPIAEAFVYSNNHNEEEVTKLFRSMIGIDGNSNKATTVRQFACKTCYRSWWRRVRYRKQVSKCIRCRVKYEPIADEREFGIGEFKCHVCSHEFKTWCQKQSTSICRHCNATLSPTKILPASKKKIKTNNNNNNKNGYAQPSMTPQYLPLVNNNNNNNNNYCQQCLGTCINLNSNVVFRPQNYPYFEFITATPNKKGTRFCPACRNIPAFSDFHVSTGSTLPSLSYQDDLDQRYFEDNDLLETCIEENDDTDNNTVNNDNTVAASSNS